ncbi:MULTISPECIES: hypothetical protein [unclassified Streptomyces]|uniref:hypothetical protein n=1 Tax=unclassified Streptomyces TaxID=2593676 RepID=UPI002E0D0E95|nr:MULTISPECIES: hypothetical protein [unclassified Streptomyces]WSQ79651.1 hypothetical protein OG725_22260 [Streptomyces sp. NBC_01213]WSQ87031.1 hypothetical protein OG722_22940 [Streptomyces sp. NBC_01212]WSR50308.1 hypothetical protein OG279_22950 [Streptomyces sp. NBC_01201]
MTSHLISVIGSSPGVGKSTLCRALVKWLTGTGASVDHFEEEDILTRPAFRPVAEEFADGAGAVRPATLVACTRDYVAESLGAGRDYLVTDALLPFIPSLVAWGHGEETLTRVMEELTRAVAPAQVTVVYIHDDPATSLRRAVEREGEAWGDWYVGKLAASPGTRAVHDLASAADHLRFEGELALRLLEASPWRLLTVDVGALDAQEAYDFTRRRLTSMLGLAGSAPTRQ